MSTRLKRWGSLLVTAALALSIVAPGIASAAIMRQGDRIAVEDGTTLRDDLYASGNRILILGDVDGDVYAAGREVLVQGRVTGNVVAAAQSIRVTGEVSGTILAAGSDISVENLVGKDVVAAGSSVTLGSRARVTRDALLAGTGVSVDGDVGKNVTVGADSFALAGTVGGGVRADCDRITFEDDALVGGDFVYRADEGTVPEANVRGELRKLPARGRRVTRGEHALFAVLAWVRSLIGLALFALLLALLFPRFLDRAARHLARSPLASLGVGFLVLILTPILAMLVFGLGILAGGWWIGLMLFAVWWIGLMVGLIVAATAIGELIIGRLGRGGRLRVLWSALLGVLVLSLVGLIPVLGWLAVFFAMLFGTGAALLAVARPGET